jgi:hypothetical protein
VVEILKRVLVEEAILKPVLVGEGILKRVLVEEGILKQVLAVEDKLTREVDEPGLSHVSLPVIADAFRCKPSKKMNGAGQRYRQASSAIFSPSPMSANVRLLRK